jgi:thioesterase domain-containing protein
MLIHKQNLEREGARFLLNWLDKKVAYREELRQRELARVSQATQADPVNFRSQLIEAAFYRALERYAIQPLPVPVLLYRPKLRPTHVFGPGKAINKDRRRIYHDNGWSRYIAQVEVFETPGNHDSMVLEPNVRILAAHLRPALEDAERAAKLGVAGGRGANGANGARNGMNGHTRGGLGDNTQAAQRGVNAGPSA